MLSRGSRNIYPVIQFYRGRFVDCFIYQLRFRRLRTISGLQCLLIKVLSGVLWLDRTWPLLVDPPGLSLLDSRLFFVNEQHKWIGVGVLNRCYKRRADIFDVFQCQLSVQRVESVFGIYQ